MADSDRRLVDRALSGDTEAFSILVERYYPQVHGVVLEKVRDRQDTQDLVQEVFVRAYQRLPSLQDGNRFGVWLSAIAGNAVTDWWRRRDSRRQRAASLLVSVTPAQPPDELAEQRDTAAHLWRAIDGLAPEYRKVLVLHYVEACTQRQIAAFLGISRAAVYWRLRKARERPDDALRQVLGTELATDPASAPRHRREILAALPVMVVVRASCRWRWPVGLVVLGGLSLAGLLGLRLRPAGGWSWSPMPPPSPPLLVRLIPQPLPALSVTWQPGRPRIGDRVRVVIAGPGLSDQPRAVLHYITDVEYPHDYVAPLRSQDETWVGELRVPARAAAVFLSPEPGDSSKVHDFDPRQPRHRWIAALRRYPEVPAGFLRPNFL